MAQPVRLARPVPDFVRVPGLHVEGKTLVGTLLVTFDSDRGIEPDKPHILHLMRLVNRRMSNGYGINLNIREASWFESRFSSYGSINVYVLKSMIGNDCAGAACYVAEVNTIRITSDAPDLYIVHELFHKLGLGHSGSSASLMFWNQGARPSRDLKTYPEEVARLVEAYR